MFLVVKPSKITFLIYNTIPQKEDQIKYYSIRVLGIGVFRVCRGREVGFRARP